MYTKPKFSNFSVGIYLMWAWPNVCRFLPLIYNSGNGISEKYFILLSTYKASCLIGNWSEDKLKVHSMSTEY